MSDCLTQVIIKLMKTVSPHILSGNEDDQRCLL